MPDISGQDENKIYIGRFYMAYLLCRDHDRNVTLSNPCYPRTNFIMINTHSTNHFWDSLIHSSYLSTQARAASLASLALPMDNMASSLT